MARPSPHKFGIAGRSKMQEAELIAAISRATAPARMLEMPQEMYTEILNRASLTDIARLCQTNRALARLCTADFDPAWQSRILRDFVLTRPYESPVEFGRVNRLETPTWFAVYQALATRGRVRGETAPTARDMARAGFLEGVANVVWNFHGPERMRLLYLLLWEACGEGHVELVRFLADEDAPFFSARSVLSTIWSCTTNAARFGQSEVIREIADNPEWDDDESKSITTTNDILWAFAEGHESTLVQLNRWGETDDTLYAMATRPFPLVHLYRLSLRKVDAQVYSEHMAELMLHDYRASEPEQRPLVVAVEEMPDQVRATVNWQGIIQKILRADWRLALLDLLSARRIPRDVVLAMMREPDARLNDGRTFVLRHFRLPPDVRRAAEAQLPPAARPTADDELKLSI